jgi:hypothetical protein
MGLGPRVRLLRPPLLRDEYIGRPPRPLREPPDTVEFVYKKYS